MLPYDNGLHVIPLFQIEERGVQGMQTVLPSHLDPETTVVEVRAPKPPGEWAAVAAMH